jgi:hypothetical protein
MPLKNVKILAVLSIDFRKTARYSFYSILRTKKPLYFARTAGNRFARDDKEPGPQLGETITRRKAS